MARIASQFPDDDTDCGWLAALSCSNPPRRLTSVERTDCLIVGAGFTGLAVARRLASLQPGWRILLVDAQRAGFGASGRCSGFVVDGRIGYVSQMSAPDAERFLRISRQGIRELEELVRKHAIDCAWDDTGWLHAAASDAGERSLDALQSWLEDRGESFQPLGREGMEAVTGSTYYHAGLRLPGSPLVHGAELLRGLARSLPGNVELFEESPVLRLRRDGGWRAESCRGSVTADRLFLALNGYLPALGFLRQRIFPLITFGSLTRVLTPGEQEVLGGEREWGVLAQDPMGSSLRRTRDQRILVRNTVHYPRPFRATAAHRRAARRAHRRSFLDRFPALAGVPFESTWGGVMGISANHQPFFGALDRDLWAAAGYNAAGIALGTISGRLLADLALGADSDPLTDLRELPGPSWLPPEPFLGIGARWRIASLNRQARGRI